MSLRFLEFNTAPVVDGVVADVFQTGILSHSDDHRHVFHVESADKQKSALVYALRISRDVLKEDVSVDVCKQYII